MRAQLRQEAWHIRQHGCGDRLYPPEQAVSRARALFEPCGITRLGRITGLDRIGIPVWMATRPASWTLAVSQGKGLTDAAAQASAAMEAMEVATAERPDVEMLRASRAALPSSTPYGSEAGIDLLASLLAVGQSLPDADEPIDWLRGHELIGDRPVWVPAQAVTLDYRPATAPRRYWQSTDGLASGGCLHEAVMHGLCERIERDASTLWAFRRPAEVASRCMDPARLGSAALVTLADRIAGAGLCLRLFDMTSDLGIPACFATISPPPSEAMRHWHHFDVASGRGCHPDPIQAALRAVTEAAQTRLTVISGARDDFDPGLYQRPIAPDLLLYPQAEPGAHRPARGPEGEGATLDGLLDMLAARNLGPVIVVPLRHAPLTVAKVLVPALENPPGRRRHSLGVRGLRALMGAA